MTLPPLWVEPGDDASPLQEPLTLGDLIDRLCERQGIPGSESAEFLRVWLTAIESEVLDEARELRRREGKGAPLAHRIRAEQAVLRLQPDLSPAGWEDETIEAVLGSERRHAHVGRQMAVWSALSPERVKAIAAALAEEFAARGEGFFFPPLGWMQPTSAGAFRVRLRSDYLTPRAESPTPAWELEMIPANEDAQITQEVEALLGTRSGA